jgi:hypothetical protein
MNSKIVGVVCMLLICTCLHACAQPVDTKPIAKNIGEQLMAPDSIIISKLGNEVCGILFAPDKVDVYTLEPKNEVDEGDYETEPHFVRKAYVGNLDKKFVDVIKFILLSNDSCYESDSTVVQTFYLPVIEFEYTKKKKSASVIISLNDGTWTVVSAGKRKLNYNYNNPELIVRLVTGIENIRPIIKDKQNDKKKWKQSLKQ